jgi:hypothetical protein
MLGMIFLLSLTAFAQIDLSAIQELSDELPDYDSFRITEEDKKFQRGVQKYRPPSRKITLDEILSSGTSSGSIKQGAVIRNLESNVNYLTHKLIYVTYFNLEDEFGFKYLASPESKAVWKTSSENVNPIRNDISLYELPLKYSPASSTIIRREYDSKLTLSSEFSFYVGQVKGDYVADLFEDKRARQGLTNQYAFHLFTNWRLPVKAGAVLHYEKSSYRLRSGGSVIYDSFSLGPQVKTKDFEVFGQTLRLDLMFRLSPLARMEADTAFGSDTFKFNSADVLVCLQRPIRNFLGEFVVGIFYQNQWLNLRDQKVPVKLNTTNETNKAYGLSLAQVFE